MGTEAEAVEAALISLSSRNQSSKSEVNCDLAMSFKRSKTGG